HANSDEGGKKNDSLLKKKSLPACWSALSESSRARIGFGGYITCIVKSVKACICAAVSGSLRPSSPSKASLKALKPASSLKAPPFGWTGGPSASPLRSPRQCSGPWLSRPRKLWVDIGPLLGCWSL